MSDESSATSPGDGTLPHGAVPQPIGGRYVLGEKLGRGNMGIVYRTNDTVLKREVAVKVPQDGQVGPDSVRRFTTETLVAARLQHPHILPVYDSGRLADGRPFLVMKLVKGRTLTDELNRRPALDIDRVWLVAVFETVCQAVAYAHASNVIHRDLKPANVMIGEFGEVQVMDWGVAKATGARPDPPTDPGAGPVSEARVLREARDEHTRAGNAPGSPAYMPPEQAGGLVARVDARSDVFALGGILAFMLTRKPPYSAGTPEDVRLMAFEGNIGECFARLEGSGAEPELVQLCKRCLNPEPAHRPANAGEVAKAVAEYRVRADTRGRQAELALVRTKAEKDIADAKATAAENARRAAVGQVVVERKLRRAQKAVAALMMVVMGVVGSLIVWRVAEGERERAREAQARAAVEAALDGAKTALEASDADRATQLLDKAEGYAKADGLTGHTDRLAGYRRDLEELRALEDVRAYSWTPVASPEAPERSGTLPSPKQVAKEWAKTFEQYKYVVGSTRTPEAVERIKKSPIRDALVAGLDRWLAVSKALGVRDLLRAVDDDPFRNEVRDRLATGEKAELAALAGLNEWKGQPTGLVLAYGESGSPKESVRTLLLRLVTTRGSDFELLMLLGGTYEPHARNGAGDRVRWFQAAAALRPSDSVALLNLGIALKDAGNSKEAVAAYEQVVRLKPDYSLAYKHLGHVLEAMGDRPGALDAYQKALGLDAKNNTHNPYFHTYLGTFFAAAGDSEKAEAEYRRAIDLKESCVEAHLNLGNLLCDRVKLKESSSGARTTWGALGNLLYARVKLKEAAEEYKRAIHHNPRYALAHYNLGTVHQKLNNLDLAEEKYRKAVELNPWYVVAYTSLGDVLWDKGQYDKAVQPYWTAFVLQPGHAEARDGLLECLRQLKDRTPTAPPR